MSETPTHDPYRPPSDPLGPAAPPPAATKPNPWARLIGALTSPGPTFRSLAARPTWIVALLTILVISTASSLVLFSRLDDEQMREQIREQLREQMESQGQPVDEETMARVEKFAEVSTRVGAAVGWAFAAGGLFLLAALFLSLNLFGGTLNYPTSLAVTLHALLPWALASLLVIPIALGRGSVTLEEIQRQTVLPSSLAVLAPADASPRLFALLGSIDLFTLWSLALFVFGYHVAARVSKGTAAGVVIAFWLLWVGIKVGLASLAPGSGG